MRILSITIQKQSIIYVEELNLKLPSIFIDKRAKQGIYCCGSVVSSFVSSQHIVFQFIVPRNLLVYKDFYDSTLYYHIIINFPLSPFRILHQSDFSCRLERNVTIHLILMDKISVFNQNKMWNEHHLIVAFAFGQEKMHKMNTKKNMRPFFIFSSSVVS